MCGRLEATPIETLTALARCDIEGDTAWLAFADGELPFVQLAAAREVDVRVAGVRLTGRVVMARVAADGAWLALDDRGDVTRGRREEPRA